MRAGIDVWIDPQLNGCNNAELACDAANTFEFGFGFDVKTLNANLERKAYLVFCLA